MITLNRIQRVIQAEEERLYLSVISNWQLNSQPNSWHPAFDVLENDDYIIVRMEIAGMQESDFKITISNKTIIIAGNRQDLSEKKAFHRMEIFFGEFRAEVDINQQFIPEDAEAFYSDGFLRILLPKVK